jgi:hypothetical protein
LKDKRAETFGAAASILMARIELLKGQISNIAEDAWVKKFTADCESLLVQKQQEWASSWQTKCSGKQFFKDLYKECDMHAPPLVLKRRLLQENKYANEGKGTDMWKLFRGTFQDLLDKK